MNKSEKCSVTQNNRFVIHKGETEKRVYEHELKTYLEAGWTKGISELHRKNNSKAHAGNPAWNKGLTKYTNESVKAYANKLSEFMKGNIPWNKGLTQNSDERVKKGAQKSIQTRIFRYGSACPYNNMDEQHKEKISKALQGNQNAKGAIFSQERKNKISAAKKGHIVTAETREKISKTKTGVKLSPDALRIKLTKQYLTHKKNNSFNTSKPEEDLYTLLLKENVNKTIYRQYKEPRYPFYCDFYIKEDDLFIELNSHWTHGGKPYDPEDAECQKQLLLWQEKAKTSKFYAQAIETWTKRDVLKKEYAIKNKLNYKVIY